MRVFRNILPVLLVAAGLISPLAMFVKIAEAQVAVPTNGTLITNTAYATYFDDQGRVGVATSNTVTSVVSPVSALTLTSSQTVQSASGAQFAIMHVLTNTGTQTVTYALTALLNSGSGYTPDALQILTDPSGGTAIVTADQPVNSVTLAPNASVNLLVTGYVPSQTPQAAAATITLTASSAGLGQSNTDIIQVSGSAQVVVSLVSPQSVAVPGEAATFNATATDYNFAAGPVVVLVNGAPSSYFLLTLPVPAGTSFISAQTGAQILYHSLGQPAGSYTITPVGQVDYVAAGVASLAVNASVSLSLTVGVNTNVSATVIDTALADWVNSASATQLTYSNQVQLPITAVAPSIAFFTPGFVQPEYENTIGNALYLQVSAPGCDTNPAQILTIPVTLTSRLTGDVEIFQATETAPGSGVFRILPSVPTANAAATPVVKGNGVMELRPNDTVVALAGNGCSDAVSTTLLIDPSGVVYSYSTDLPVAGSVVHLINVANNAPAAVYQYDGVTPAPSTVTTGSDGIYSFPLVAPGTYQIVVTPPAGYAFPSKTSPTNQPAGRTTSVTGSFGQAFTISGQADAPVVYDIPLDSAAPKGKLFITQTANQSIVQIGDFVDYSVQINNNTGETLTSATMLVTLPAGLTYVRGTATLNGVRIADPTGNAAQLVFALGTLPVGATPILRYRVSVGPNASTGGLVDSAQAFANDTQGPIGSNVSPVTVQIVGGVFSDKAYVIGKVFADCHLTKMQEDGDPGVPGVRIYFNNGDYAITDTEGKYSFYGLTPRTHVAQVDTTTLPAGVKMEILDNRNALNPNSQFVDLQNGEMQKVNFAIAGCSPDLLTQIAARKKALKNPSELTAAAGILLSGQYQQSSLLQQQQLLQPQDAGGIGLPGSGTAVGSMGSASMAGPQIGSVLPGQGGGMIPTSPGAPMPGGGRVPGGLGAVGDPGGSFAPFAQGQPSPIYTPTTTLFNHSAPGGVQDEVANDDPDMTAPLESVILSLRPGTGFIGLHDGEVLGTDQSNVRLQGPTGALLALSVNGVTIPASRVGKKSTDTKTGITAWEYIGVDLQPGVNTLSMTVQDGFGNSRGSATIHVTAPGKLAQININAPKTAVADGATAIPVVISLLDARGHPIPGRAVVTLQSTLGQWQTTSVNPNVAGTQVIVTNGVGTFLLVPPVQPGADVILAADGTISAKTNLTFSPNLRPMIAVGLVSGTVSLRNLNPADLQPAQSGDVFSRQIQGASESFAGGKGEAAARTAFFLKGKILGSTLLTLSYDSDKPSDTTLFRDIQPDQFYPVYGDSSARGYEAQSTGRLYVLLQHGTDYVLIGDYSTQTQDPARQLSQVSRVLNGIKGQVTKGPVTVSGFASSTNSTQIVQQFPANGTSGPFQLNINGVVNSAQVDVITYDRNQRSVIVNDTPLAQYTDYTIEPYSGLLLLNQPVPTLDSNLDPIYIRVSYSIVTGGPKHTVAGAAADVKVGSHVTVGANVMQDNDPLNRQTIVGANGTFNLPDSTVAVAEVARTTSALYGQGLGERLDIRHQGNVFDFHVWGTRTDAGFYNQSSIQSEGEAEYGLKASYALNQNNRIVAEALDTSDSVTGAKQQGESLSLVHNLPDNIVVEIGMRHSATNEAAALATPASTTYITPIRSILPNVGPAVTSALVGYTSVRLKLTAPVPYLPKASVFGVAEQAISGGGRELGVGGTYNINQTTKAYFRYDFMNTLNGPYTLDPAIAQYTAVAGISTALTPDTQLFNEYRMGDALAGRDAENATGLRHLWHIGNGFGISAGFQKIKPIYGAVTDASTAVDLGGGYTGSDKLKASADAQWQTSQVTQSLLFTAAMAAKVTPSFTILNRGIYNTQQDVSPATGSRRLMILQTGFAYRPVNTDVWNMLSRLEYKNETDSTLGAGLNLNQSSLVGATNINYQPTKWLWIDARYAFDKAHDGNNGIPGDTLYQMAGLRGIADIAPRWDVGAQGFEMWGNGQTQTALGVEVGYLVWRDIWLSLGYDFEGFNNPDLAGSQYTLKGVYFRMRFKFDQDLFDGGP